jgi:peptidoglycan LD-endopeptidase CwlK
MSRYIADLIPEMQEKFKAFSAKMAEAGIPFILTCTYRSQEEQDRLYSQGRHLPGKIVTWTQHSRHTQRDAFDIALLNKGTAHWDTKEDLNENSIPDYTEAGLIGESVGLVWGGRWKNRDLPHFQNS